MENCGREGVVCNHTMNGGWGNVRDHERRGFVHRGEGSVGQSGIGRVGGDFSGLLEALRPVEAVEAMVGGRERSIGSRYKGSSKLKATPERPCSR